MKPWLDSNTVRYLLLTWLAGSLLQVVPMLQQHTVDWWALGAQAVATLAGILIRIAQNDVQAPISLLNRGTKE